MPHINTVRTEPYDRKFNNTDTPTGIVLTKSRLESVYGLTAALHQYRVEYRSCDGVQGKEARTDSAAIFLPQGPIPEEGWPVIVWHHGTVGIACECAPSLNVRSARDSQYLNTWLSLGYAVVAPDYPGLGSQGLHHYLHARSVAWSVLDGIRAALKVFPLKNRIVLIGHSQGAHAAFSTAGYQAHYAPELNITGSVLTGTPYFAQGRNFDSMISLAGSMMSGDSRLAYIFYIWHSAADINSSLDYRDFFYESVRDVIIQSKTLKISAIKQVVMDKGLTLNNSIRKEIWGVLHEVLPHMAYPTLKIMHPVFIGIGGNDINVPVVMQNYFAEDVADSGTSSEVHIYPELDHSATLNYSLLDSVPFVKNKMRTFKKCLKAF